MYRNCRGKGLYRNFSDFFRRGLSALGPGSDLMRYLDFLDSIKKAGAVRTLESLARIELGAQGGALLERVTTTRISKSGVATTTVRERFTAPDWHADGWFWTGLGGRSSSCQTTIRRRRLISWVQAMEEELKMLRSGVAALLHRTTPVPGANVQLRGFCADLGRLLVASRPAESYDEGPGAPKSR